ncbi:MAG TPA: MFS transporter [Gaiellaceae bacterium]|nr:MFS transporter [Gaiellaceae bacterium]
MISLRERAGALAERPFRLLWLGQTTSAIGDVMVPVALAFAVFQIGGGGTELGLVLASLAVGRMAFILVGGVWADRLPRRLVMLTCDAIRAAVDAFIAVALLTGAMEVWMFVVTSFLFGAAEAFFLPAATGLVPQTISAGRLQQANALLALSRSTVQVVGPALSAVIVAASEPGWVFAIDALSFVASAAFLAVLPVAAAQRAPRKPFLSDLSEGARATWSFGWMRAALTLTAIAILGMGIFLVLGPVLSKRDLNGATSWGLILSAGAIGGIVGGIVALRLRPQRPLVGAFSAWSLSALPALAFVPPLPTVVIAIAYGVYQAGIAFGNNMFETVMQREVPRELLSRVDSFTWLVALGLLPLGQALAGPLSDAVGTDAVLIGAAALVVVSCAAGIAAPSVRAITRGTPGPPPAYDSAGGSPAPAPPALPP